MKRFERTVSFYDLRVTSTSRQFEAPAPISSARALELLSLIPAAARIKAYSNDDHVYYIKDFDVVDGVYRILINKCDRQLADPRFSDPVNASWRTAAREGNEGLDFSSHILIRPSTDPLGLGLSLVENATGLSIIFIQRFLNALLRDVEALCPEAFEFPHPDGSVDARGQPKKYRSRFFFAFDGHPSDALVEALEEGSINGIELITASNRQGALDTHGYVREVRKTLAIKLGDQINPGSRVDTIKAFFQSRSGAYETARISFVDPDGLSRSVKVTTTDFTVEAESIFVKRAVIDGFTAPLEQAYEALNPAIIAKMRALLN
ncbi:hypothetical protein [Paraburkholderia sediminicola]|uniref:hypothetical protein n=1 Tax=Paraburkholderia sediminicola TaxID=458836 RepID=UPI0038BACAE0